MGRFWSASSSARGAFDSGRTRTSALTRPSTRSATFRCLLTSITPIRRRTGNGIRRFLRRSRLGGGSNRGPALRSFALRVVGRGGRVRASDDVACRLRHVQARACRRCRAAHCRRRSRTRFRRAAADAINTRARQWPSRDCRGDDNDARARGCGAPRTGARRRRSAGATLFIHPGVDFHVIDGLLTNFHLPRSSLLMLVSAFAGRERVLAAYQQAVAERYRFYSYGDAMLIV